MRIPDVITAINASERDGVIDRYAIGDAMGATPQRFEDIVARHGLASAGPSTGDSF